MVSTDPISDMLSRIRNALQVHKNTTRLPYSKIKYSVAEQLARSGFIDSVRIDDTSNFKEIELVMHQPNQPSRITKIERLSKPGRRYYAKADEIPSVLRGRGVVVVSTSAGIMTGDQARKQRLGGELICKVY